MKKLILFLCLMSFSFAIEMSFDKTQLPKFKLQGISSKIIYKSKADRDFEIGRLWTKFLNSKEFDIKKSTDKKLYVTYSNYKTNSFDCFIGFKTKSHVNDLKTKLITNSNYQKSILKYEKNMNMSNLWDEIEKKKLKRNFKIDIEEYDLLELQKNSYFVNIYLSTK